MRFKIETSTDTSSAPVASADLKAHLESRREAWLETTPQEHPEGSPEKSALDAAEQDVNELRLSSKDAAGAAQLRKASVRLAELVKQQSANPNAEMEGALALIDEGIQMALLAAEAYAMPVRVAIVGHYSTLPLHLNGGKRRLSVNVDDGSVA
jgi:hypothetical protein